MGRMADARKRARRGDSAVGVPPAPPEAAAPDERAAAPEAERVFADEPPGAEAPPGGVAPRGSGAAATGGKVELPASGLAEDILRGLQAEPTLPEPAARVELPASGLAEDVLAPAAPAPGGHSLSFFAAPVQDQRAATEASEHLATFFLDREEYGVDVRQVQEIRRVTEITAVPRAPEFVRGVINLRGRILPVLDLKRKLGLGEVETGRATRIVVVRVKERLLGLLVDGASQVLKVFVSRIEPPPEEVVEKGGDYIRGVAKLEDRLIILVDLERLLAHELRAAGAPSGPARPGLGPDGVS
jgi:purine-binding chemotaxis protein CheW